MTRYVCQFSCGAASAVAAKLTQARFDNVVFVNAFIAEEHPDNQRFLSECEGWLGSPIVRLRDEKYGASAYEVFRRNRFIKSAAGAKCSKVLKRLLLDDWSQPEDVPVLGFTAEERERADRFIIRQPDAYFPLIESGITKPDCLAIIERAGLRLPEMYRLGYNNANCIGCVKGGKGYWNKIRRDFPNRFEEMCRIEESLGPKAYLFFDPKTKTRFSLRQLPLDAGRHDKPEIDCGFACEAAEQEIEACEVPGA